MTEPILNASARIMYQEAQRRGIRCTTFGDKQTILMELGKAKWYTRGSRSSLQSSVGYSIAENKALTKQILNHFHLPTARAVEVNSEQKLSHVYELSFPLVMKPLSGKHGQGVFVGVRDEAQAKQLFLESSGSVLFEEMLTGIEFRVICINFRFVAAAFRKPAHVIGDGQHTITELINEKNKHPWRGKGHFNNLSFIEVDMLVENYLHEQGHSLTSILLPGQEVPLRKTANLSTGGEAWDVTDDVCPENRALFENIARVCDLNTIGIDIMCQSLSTPIIQQHQAGVIEVNSSPGLRMHHFPIQGTPKNVAGMIIDMILSQLEPKE